MITAEEFLIKRQKELGYNPCIDLSRTKETLIEFAKLHVKECKEEIADDYLYYLEGDEGSERLNEKKFKKEAYPLELIK